MDFRLFMPPQVGLDFTKALEALANGLSDNAAAARFSTERGAEIALVHALDTIDGAVPALTSEQQEYVKRERAFVKKRETLLRANPPAVAGKPSSRPKSSMNGWSTMRWIGCETTWRR